MGGFVHGEGPSGCELQDPPLQTRKDGPTAESQNPLILFCTGNHRSRKK
jgi:hypothetical protein